MQFSPKLARFVRRALLTIGVLITVLALVILVENWRGDRAWEAYETKALARGQLLKEFPAPSKVPASDNFLRTPCLEPLLFADTNSPEHNAFSKSAPQGGSELSGWARGKVFDFIKFGSLQSVAKKSGSESATTPQGVLQFLAPMEPFLDELRKAAVARPLTELTRPVPIGNDRPYKAPIPRFQFIRASLFALDSHACASLATGNGSAAFEDALAALRFCHGILECPDILLVEAMIGSSNMSIALQPVWEATRRHQWTDAQLQRLQQELDQIQPLRALERSLHHERLNALWCMDHLKPSLQWFVPDGFIDIEKNTWASLVLFPRGWVKQNKVSTAEGIQWNIDLLAACGTPAFLPTLAQRDLAERAFESGNAYFPYTLITRMVLPAFRKVIVGATVTEAKVNLAKTACALERHRLAKGRYPEALSELLPQFLEQVPLDVINGQPLRYSLQPNDSYRLYSIGMNGVDEGGTLSVKTSGDQYLDGDLLWPELSTP